jgi:hypothetical protein
MRMVGIDRFNERVVAGVDWNLGIPQRATEQQAFTSAVPSRPTPISVTTARNGKTTSCQGIASSVAWTSSKVSSPTGVEAFIPTGSGFPKQAHGAPGDRLIHPWQPVRGSRRQSFRGPIRGAPRATAGSRHCVPGPIRPQESGPKAGRKRAESGPKAGRKRAESGAKAGRKGGGAGRGPVLRP